MRVAEFYLKHLKRGCNRTEGREHKGFKKEGKLGQGVDALKKGGWNHLTNYEFDFSKLCKKRTLPGDDFRIKFMKFMKRSDVRPNAQNLKIKKLPNFKYIKNRSNQIFS